MDPFRTLPPKPRPPKATPRGSNTTYPPSDPLSDAPSEPLENGENPDLTPENDLTLNYGETVNNLPHVTVNDRLLLGELNDLSFKKTTVNHPAVAENQDFMEVGRAAPAQKSKNQDSRGLPLGTVKRKRHLSGQEFREMLQDPDRERSALARLDRIIAYGSDKDAVKAAELLWAYARGKPTQTISGPDGGPIQSESKVLQATVMASPERLADALRILKGIGGTAQRISEPPALPENASQSRGLPPGEDPDSP